MMIEKIGAPAMCEQAAEECTELAKAFLKLARIIRNENPTPVTMEEAMKVVREEYTDVVTCAREIKLEPDEELIARKQERFKERWTETMKMDKEKIIHAHWELAPEDTAYDNVWICSNCGEDFTQHRKPKFIYCPHCGAKMDEPDTGGKQQNGIED